MYHYTSDICHKSPTYIIVGQHTPPRSVFFWHMVTAALHIGAPNFSFEFLAKKNNLTRL